MLLCIFLHLFRAKVYLISYYFNGLHTEREGGTGFLLQMSADKGSRNVTCPEILDPQFFHGFWEAGGELETFFSNSHTPPKKRVVNFQFYFKNTTQNALCAHS